VTVLEKQTPVTDYSNRELGQLWMAAVLSELYEAWPAKLDFDPYEVGRSTGVVNDDDGMTRDHLQLWIDLTDWMVREGMIVPGFQAAGGEMGAVQLTSIGFALLNKPVPGSTDKSTGERFKEIAGDAGKAAVKSGAQSIGKELAEVAGTFIGNLAKPFIS
jgi:hypothetical protein